MSQLFVSLLCTSQLHSGEDKYDITYLIWGSKSTESNIPTNYRLIKQLISQSRSLAVQCQVCPGMLTERATETEAHTLKGKLE